MENLSQYRELHHARRSLIVTLASLHISLDRFHYVLPDASRIRMADMVSRVGVAYVNYKNWLTDSGENVRAQWCSLY